MKKLFLVFVLLFSISTLTACDFNDIEIVDGELGLVYETPEYKDGSWFMVVYLTNGLDHDVDVSNLDVDISTDDDLYWIAAANFDVNDIIPEGEYLEVELEFFGDGVLSIESDLETEGYTIEDVNDVIVTFVYYLED